MSFKCRKILNDDLGFIAALLRGNDAETNSLLFEQMVEQGANFRPSLRRLLKKESNEQLCNFYESVLDKIRFNELLEKLDAWLNDDPKAQTSEHLLTGLLLVEHYLFGRSNHDSALAILDDLLHSITKEVDPAQTPEQLADTIYTFLFKTRGFTAVNCTGYSPMNFCLGHVLTAKRGEPIILLALFLMLAKRLNLHITGILTPSQTLVAHAAAATAGAGYFYVKPDPIIGGIIPSSKLSSFLQSDAYNLHEHDFQPCNNYIIMHFLPEEFSEVYSYDEHPAKKREIEHLDLLLGRHIQLYDSTKF